MLCPKCKNSTQVDAPGGVDEKTGKGVIVKRDPTVASLVAEDGMVHAHCCCSHCGHGWVVSAPAEQVAAAAVSPLGD